MTQKKRKPLKKSDQIPSSEFSDIFVQGMYDRMAVSYFKYGRVADAYPEKLDALESLQQRLNKYNETGNTEYLMDAANFAMIEFMHPKLSYAFFKATDSSGSPGRVKRNRVITTKHNLDLK